MMNILAFSLLLTTLLTASVHSPNPPLKNQEDVILKDGHRAVMVEFDEHGHGNTKVSISSDDHSYGYLGSSIKDKINGVVGDAKDMLNQDIVTKTKSGFWGAADSVSDKAKQASNMAGGGMRNVKSKVEGNADTMAKRGKSAVGGAIDTTKNLKGDVKRTATKRMRYAVDKIIHQCRSLYETIFGSMRLYMRILQLFGFATAYGMSIWVNFMSSFMLSKLFPKEQFANVQSEIYQLYFKAMTYSVGLALVAHLLSEGRVKNFASLRNFQGLNLLSTLLMILGNLLYFEPRCRKVMFEKLKWEKEEGTGVPANTTTTGTRKTAKSTEATEATEVADSVPSPTTRAPETTTTTTTEKSAAPPVGESASEARPKIVELSEALKNLNSYSSYLNILTLMGLTLHLVNLGQRLCSLGTTCY